jgi:hypothetical protein
MTNCSIGRFGNGDGLFGNPTKIRFFEELECLLPMIVVSALFASTTHLSSPSSASA